MNLLYERCAGLDVHKKNVLVCATTPDSQGQRHKERRTFSTMTPELLRMRHWLKDLGVTHVAMESTGSFWKPIFNILEGHMEVLVVNAQHLKAVPGRKTDVKDAEWIADLLQHGLLRASFVPPAPQRELRELTRYRTRLVEERSRIINRLQKTLEDANLKLASVARDLMGRSARDMLAALLAGEADPSVLAQLARGRMRAKRDLLEQALQGLLKPHHRFLLSEQLADIDALDEAIEHMSAEIAQRLRPYEALLRRPETIPGIKRRLAEVILAEIGLDMSRFRKSRGISLPGPGCALATTRARANGSPAGRAKAVRGCARHWWRRLMRRSTVQTLISRPSISAWPSGEVGRRPRLRLAIPCW